MHLLSLYTSHSCRRKRWKYKWVQHDIKWCLQEKKSNRNPSGILAQARQRIWFVPQVGQHIQPRLHLPRLLFLKKKQKNNNKSFDVTTLWLLALILQSMEEESRRWPDLGNSRIALTPWKTQRGAAGISLTRIILVGHIWLYFNTVIQRGTSWISMCVCLQHTSHLMFTPTIGLDTFKLLLFIF